MTKILELITLALAAVRAIFNFKAEQAKGEKEKREAAEHEAEIREKQQAAAAEAAGLAHDPDAFADKLRDGV